MCLWRKCHRRLRELRHCCLGTIVEVNAVAEIEFASSNNLPARNREVGQRSPGPAAIYPAGEYLPLNDVKVSCTRISSEEVNSGNSWNCRLLYAKERRPWSDIVCGRLINGYLVPGTKL